MLVCILEIHYGAATFWRTGGKQTLSSYSIIAYTVSVAILVQQYNNIYVRLCLRNPWHSWRPPISACCDSKQQVIDTLMAESTTAMKWFEANTMQANPGKFHAIILKEPSDSRTTLIVGNTIITTDESAKLLGVHLDRHIDSNKQIKELLSSCATSTIAPWCGISVVLQTPIN